MPVTNRTSAIARSAPSGAERARWKLLLLGRERQDPVGERQRPSARAGAPRRRFPERDRSTPGHPCRSERMATSAPSVASPAASRALQSLVPLRAEVASARTTASGDTHAPLDEEFVRRPSHGLPTESA